MGVRQVSGEKEEKAFEQVLHYCFQGDAGEGMFPLKNGARAWADFDGDRVVAGLVEVPLEIHLLGEPARMLGIGGVASLPENRNGGSVRRLHEAVLNQTTDQGYTVSGLYPFSFSFYQKFGYGNLGPRYSNQFAPEDIRPAPVAPGYAITSPAPQELANQIHSWWYSEFWSQYDFSDARDTTGLSEQLQHWMSKGKYLRACCDHDGMPTGMIVYSISPPRNWERTLTIERIAWKDGPAFRSLMNFLWSHRGQCATVEVNWPAGEFVPGAMIEPRISRTPNYTWMGRPADLLDVLKRKAKFEDFEGKISIKLEDPCMPANTGTYTVRSHQVSFQPGPVASDLPFHLFSSLLFGAFTPAEIALQVDVPFDLETATRLFRPRSVFITEGF